MDYSMEQEMEIEALQAILMDDIEEFTDENNPGQRSFRILISAEDTDADVRVALVFAHTPTYPDEPPQLDVQSVKGLRDSETRELKEKLQSEALENLGMAMMYTLVTSAKEWLTDKFAEEAGSEAGSDEEEEELDDVVEPHGEQVTVETFVAWRERFEAELALERARLLPDSALVASKEKKPSGRAWFENGLKSGKAAVAVSSDEAEDDEEDFEDDADEDEDEMLDHYLSQQA